MKRMGSILALSLTSLWAGCDQPAEIRRYQVAHESLQVADLSAAANDSAAPSPSVPQRMLAAIVPLDEQTWFFKSVGPTEQIDRIADKFGQWLDSVKFDQVQAPEWTLPDGWTQRPGDQFRYATLVADGVEVSISQLRTPQQDSAQGSVSEAFVLSNVNRWRGQLELPPIDMNALGATTQSVQVDGHQAVLVDLTGQAPAEGGTRRGPFQGPSDRQSAPRTSPPVAPSRASDRGMTYDKPAEWREGPPNSFRLASFVVEENGQTAEITVIPLGPAAGSLLDNVNRWRGQINLPPISQVELDAAVTQISVDGNEGNYVRISDPAAEVENSILAVIVPQSHQTVFIKMIGPQELVQAHTNAFEQFVRSIRLAKP